MSVGGLAPLGRAHRDRAVALWAETGLTRPWNDPAADFDRAAQGPSSAVLGIVEADALVGSVMVGHDGHRGWVYYLSVADSHRGSGLGRRLMDGAESWLHERGVPKVVLMVRETNAQVLGFYDRLGYRDDEVRVLGKWLDAEAEARRYGPPGE